MRRPRGAPIFGPTLPSNDSTSSTPASTRRHPLVNIRVHVGPSRIAGQGLFAEQEIKQGTNILRYIGQKITQEESDRRLAAGNVYIFGLDERYALDGVRPRTRHALSTMRVNPTATRNSSATPSGLSRSGISRQARNSPTTTDTSSMMSPQSPATAAQSIVVALSWVPNIGTASSRQRLGNVSSWYRGTYPRGMAVLER